MDNSSKYPAASASPAANRRFRTPTPNAPLMWALGFVNRWLLVRGYFRIRGIDLPRHDLDRLRRAVNRSTAAFLAPNHPEFGFDWMMDKELSTLVAPRMASWAAHEIVATAPRFWRRNNLVANDGGDAATAYSVDWALEGNGVLAHPEGMVHWTADRIHPLFGGIAEMAITAACEAERRRLQRPVYIVPIVWKVRYAHDISARLDAEMTLIERALGLPDGGRHRIADRFVDLQERILARQMAQFGFYTSPAAEPDFFNRQSAFRAYLVAELQARYRVQLGESTDRTIHRLARAIAARRRNDAHDAESRLDAQRVREAARLGGFSRDVYDTPVLTQEQIAESLKRIRAALMRDGLRNTVHNYLPTPFGRRIAHVRVPEPIRVEPVRDTGDEGERRACVADLTREARARMQAALDSINAEIAADVLALSHPNPFAAHGAARAA